jgi:hypothetical protein
MLSIIMLFCEMMKNQSKNMVIMMISDDNENGTTSPIHTT